jgi:hypothetical protein
MFELSICVTVAEHQHRATNLWTACMLVVVVLSGHNVASNHAVFGQLAHWMGSI